MTRLKRILLHEAFLPGFFKTGEIHVRCINGLPQDAEFVRWFQQDGRIEIIFNSNEFPELNDGDIIPLLNPEFEKL